VGRLAFIGLGVILSVAGLAAFGLATAPLGLALGYLAVQTAASTAQAGHQVLLPDIVPGRSRGSASGVKGFLDLAGATLGFVLLGALLGRGALTPALLLMGSALLAGYLLAIVLLRGTTNEPGAPTRPRPSLAAAFRLDLTRHRSFVRLVAARFFFLLGTYAIGRFLLLFVGARLKLPPPAAAEQAGALLASLALITLIFSLPAGWAADRLGRRPLMLLGAALSAAGALLLIAAATGAQMLIFGGLLSLGSAAFASANWAMTADLAPGDEAGRFLGLANFGTAGAAAAAGLFGPLIDWAERSAAEAGFVALFIAAAFAFALSALSLRGVTEESAEHASEQPAALVAVMPRVAVGAARDGSQRPGAP
jgi:Na+/melibiose symporter-like transporter